MKPFKTIDEQLELLKFRGLNFTDEEKAKRFLLNKNLICTVCVIKLKKH